MCPCSCGLRCPPGSRSSRPPTGLSCPRTQMQGQGPPGTWEHIKALGAESGNRSPEQLLLYFTKVASF